MKHCKQAMNDIGATFSPQTEIDRRNAIHRKIADIKSSQKKIETSVKLFKPSNLPEIREEYKKLNKEIKKLEGQL